MSYDSGTGVSTSDLGDPDYEYAIEDNDEVVPLTKIRLLKGSMAGNKQKMTILALEKRVLAQVQIWIKMRG